MLKSIYSLNDWNIKKDKDLYLIFKGRKKIDESKNFEEAYALLQQHKKNK